VVVVLAVPLVKLATPDAVKVVVVVAVALSVPVTVFPEVTCPATPTPPDTVRAPVAVVVLAVAFVSDVMPEAESVPVMVVFVEASVPVTVFPEVTCPTTPTPPET